MSGEKQTGLTNEPTIEVVLDLSGYSAAEVVAINHAIKKSPWLLLFLQWRQWRYGTPNRTIKPPNNLEDTVRWHLSILPASREQIEIEARRNMTAGAADEVVEWLDAMRVTTH